MKDDGLEGTMEGEGYMLEIEGVKYDGKETGNLQQTMKGNS